MHLGVDAPGCHSLSKLVVSPWMTDCNLRTTSEFKELVSSLAMRQTTRITEGEDHKEAPCLSSGRHTGYYSLDSFLQFLSEFFWSAKGLGLPSMGWNGNLLLNCMTSQLISLGLLPDPSIGHNSPMVKDIEP